ncbi:MAG: hypothetical protein U5K43_13850 [Halofilum sp. (in: g-proteobacteria)]|nr:hypothetical protein [Halofilum sp. (in: g-proteobacteria)]
MPSSQSIYGIVVMLTLSREVTVANGPGLFGIGVLAGIALLYSGMHQGNACAAAINVSKNKAWISGPSLAPRGSWSRDFAVFVSRLRPAAVREPPGALRLADQLPRSGRRCRTIVRRLGEEGH